MSRIECFSVADCDYNIQGRLAKRIQCDGANTNENLPITEGRCRLFLTFALLAAVMVTEQ